MDAKHAVIINKKNYRKITSKIRGSENRLGVSRWYVSCSWGQRPVFSYLAVLVLAPLVAGSTRYM